MRISIVNGFFLPVPPISGGSTEKSWYNLAREFTTRGHTVTMFSRRWRGFPHRESSEGIQHVRLPGANHQRQLWRNLLLDFIWSWRVFFALPTADIVVVNAVALPGWLGWLKPRAGQVVLMTGRMPKGQYRYYRNIARILAASSFVREKVIQENSALESVTHIYGYPLNWGLLAHRPAPAQPFFGQAKSTALTIGFVGRIHTEKGLQLLGQALQIVGQSSPELPPWHLLLCGPADIAHGGSGADFKRALLNQLSEAMPGKNFTLLDPQFHDATLAGVYQRIDIFCYPSLAEKGETFGVAVAEAMAAGAVPVVSQLACFTDFVRDGQNGLVFDHRAPDASAQLAHALIRLIADPCLRQKLGAQARQDARAYDYATYAETLLADFAQLTTAGVMPSSPP
jgi:glycosyltransferase involved in cell wall biosynthesis